MFRQTLFCAATLCTSFVLTGPARAQHHHHAPAHHHHASTHHIPQHHHHGYRYYVPTYQPAQGAYYTYNNTQYYTPPITVAPAAPVHTVQRPIVVQHGGFSRTEDLAQRLEAGCKLLCWDMYYNYQHNPNYREAYREAYQLMASAQYVHGSEHGGDREAIRRTVGGMDELLHHVQQELQGWSRNHQRQVGQLDIVAKMQDLEATVHHLMNDVGVIPTHDAPPAPAGGIGAAGTQPPPPPGAIPSAASFPPSFAPTSAPPNYPPTSPPPGIAP